MKYINLQNVLKFAGAATLVGVGLFSSRGHQVALFIGIGLFAAGALFDQLKAK